jgi:hypothetical protein
MSAIKLIFRNMLALIKTRLKRLIAVTALLFTVVQSNAQENTVSVHAGPKGIWVLCGQQLPKQFTYRVLRQKNKEGWTKLTDLAFPGSKEAMQAEMLNAQQAARLEVSALSSVRLDLVWERLTNVLSINVPAEMQNNYPLLQAAGAAWFDAAVDSAVNYSYKVQLIGNKNEVLRENITKEAACPGKKPEALLAPVSIKSIADGSMIGEFAVVQKGRMNSCKVFRSYYLRSGFEEIQGEPIFLNRDSALILQFTDKTAVEKVPYVYVIRPIDAAGNAGPFSAELRAFNVADKSIVPSVRNFKTTSVEQEKAIKLSWSLKDNKDVISIDIFKGATYDGAYVKIASVAPKDTTYFDHYANPVETYFYTIRLNGTYEKSPSSPRIPGILKASNINHYPPQNLRLVQSKNIVHLTWERTEADTRAYYVYRSIGKTYKMERIGRLIITDSAMVSYTDTLPETTEAGVYAYAVADQNTSYAISGITAPVFAYSKGINALPIPFDLSVLQLKPGILQVIWPNMSAGSPFIQGYMLYRRAKSISGTETEPLKPVSAKILSSVSNSYTDSTVKDGMIYYYSLRTVADDEKTMSSPSNEAGFTIPTLLVSGASNLRVSPAGKSVMLKWDNPLDNDIKIARLIRATEGKEGSEEIAVLNSGSDAYTDTKVAKGDTYYYQVQMENNKGKKSKLTDAVGIKIYE